MTRKQQIQLIYDLCGSIIEEVKGQIICGKIPDEWDGHELRRLLVDKFSESASMTDKRSQRYRNYENTRIVNNL